MNFHVLKFFLLVFILSACNQKEIKHKILIKNPLSEPVSEFVYEINSPMLIQSIDPILKNGLVIWDNDKELPYQIVQKGNGTTSILVQANFAPNEEKEIILKEGQPTKFPHKTQAEITVKEGGEWLWVTKRNGNQQYEYRGGKWKHVNSIHVDKKHTDHSFDIRYEGPGWESDKIAYRFYLDWRNANDIFGKLVDTLVLQGVGLDGFDSYHEMCDWGADLLKVGRSLGVGSIGHWANSTANRVAKTDSLYSEVTYSGPLKSKITTRYYGWENESGKTDLTAELSICAGNYLTKNELTTSLPIENLCTGIVKHDQTIVLNSDREEGEWAYLATFGKQTLHKDLMGMCIFYRKSYLIELTEDKYSHVVVLKPENQQLTYYFGAVWEKDASQMDSPEKFEAFLNKQLALLNAGMMN